MKKTPLWVLHASLVVVFLFLAPGEASAYDQDYDYSPFWWKASIGYGNVSISKDHHSSDQYDAFHLGFSGGIVVDPTLLLGIEMGGWIIESEDHWDDDDWDHDDGDHDRDDDDGEGFSHIQLVGILRPADTNLSLSGGFGYATYWDNTDPDYNGNGWSMSLGAGYSFMTPIGLAITPGVSYTYARVRDHDRDEDNDGRSFDIFSFTIGLSYNSGGRTDLPGPRDRGRPDDRHDPYRYR